MENRALMIMSLVLVCGIVAGGFLFYQGAKNLRDTQAQLTNLEGEISNLEGNLITFRSGFSQNSTASSATAIDAISNISPAIVRIDATVQDAAMSGSGTTIDGIQMKGFSLFKF